MIKKRNRILSKVKSKYWTRTQKYGVKIPDSVNESIAIYKSNGTTLWWEAISQEMKNVRISFGIYEVTVEDLSPGYQDVGCRIIFNFKMGYNFLR